MNFIYISENLTVFLHRTDGCFFCCFKAFVTTKWPVLKHARDDVKWTFISPAGDFQADGERTGKYILAGEELTLNSKGESIISYADYAIAMVDEIEKGSNIKKRISVVRE